MARSDLHRHTNPQSSAPQKVLQAASSPRPASHPPLTSAGGRLNSAPRWVLTGRSLGRGSFGNVDLALDLSTSSLFAVKSCAVPRAQGPPPPSAALLRSSLLNELRILQRLRYHRIIDCLGSENLDDAAPPHSASPLPPTPFLLLEFLPRGSIADLLHKSPCGRLSEPLSRLCTRAITQGLAYLHSHGIVHCDIKGRNVLVGEDIGCIKIADFGSAKLAGSGSDVRSGYRGSPLWMAPEVMQGVEQESASDIWSLGCTLVEMMQGSQPWMELKQKVNQISHSNGAAASNDDQLYHLLLKIACSEETPPYPANASEQALDFLSVCLRRDPRERWSAEQLLGHPFLQIDAEEEREIEARFLHDFGPCATTDIAVEHSCLIISESSGCSNGDDANEVAVEPTMASKLAAAESPRGVLDFGCGDLSGSSESGVSSSSSTMVAVSERRSMIVGVVKQEEEDAAAAGRINGDFGGRRAWVTVRGSDVGCQNFRQPFATGYMGSPEMRRNGEVSIAFLAALQGRHGIRRKQGEIRN